MDYKATKELWGNKWNLEDENEKMMFNALYKKAQEIFIKTSCNVSQWYIIVENMRWSYAKGFYEGTVNATCKQRW